MKRALTLLIVASLVCSPMAAQAKTLQEVIDSTTIDSITTPIVKAVDVSIRTLLKLLAAPFYWGEQVSEKY